MSFENDIALLKLEEDVVFNENVAPIEFRKASLNNRRVTVIGWGNISQDSREFPKDLMEVDVVVINRFLCNLPGWLNGQVKPSMFALETRLVDKIHAKATVAALSSLKKKTEASTKKASLVGEKDALKQ